MDYDSGNLPETVAVSFSSDAAFGWGETEQLSVSIR